MCLAVFEDASQFHAFKAICQILTGEGELGRCTLYRGLKVAGHDLGFKDCGPERDAHLGDVLPVPIAQLMGRHGTGNSFPENIKCFGLQICEPKLMLHILPPQNRKPPDGVRRQPVGDFQMHKQ